MRTLGLALLSLLRSLGALILVAGVLLVAGGVFYWAMGWPYRGIVVTWTATWGLPLVGVGAGLVWARRRAAGFLAIACGMAAMILLLVDGSVLWFWPCAAVSAAAVLLGAAITGFNRPRP